MWNFLNIPVGILGFLSRHFVQLPQWAQLCAYFSIIIYLFLVTIFSLQGYFIYEGWVKREKGNDDFKFEKNVQVIDNNADVRVVTDSNGKIAFPVKIVSYYISYFFNQKLSLLVEAQKGLQEQVKGSLGGFFDRRINIVLPKRDGDLDSLSFNETQESDKTNSLFASAFAQEQTNSEALVLEVKSIKFSSDESKHSYTRTNPTLLDFRDGGGESLLGVIDPSISVRSGIAVLRNQVNEISGGWYVKLSSDDGIKIINLATEEEIAELIIEKNKIEKGTNFMEKGDGIEIVFQPRKPYEAIYFEKEKDDSGKELDNIKNAAKASKIWFRVVESNLPNKPTNAVFFGHDVPFKVAKDFLKELTRQTDLRLQRIAYEVRLRSGLQYTIQLGSSTSAMECKTIAEDTIKEMVDASSFETWNKSLSKCQRG